MADHDPLRVFDREHAAIKPSNLQRTRSARASVEAFAPLMHRLGITRVADITGLDVIGVPVFTAIRPCARSLTTGQGKGLDVDTARISALMESAESWHAEHVRASLTWDTYLGLRRRANVIDVGRLPLARGATLDLAEPQMFIEGWDLLRERSCWLPFDMVDSAFIGARRPVQHAMTSIGLAAGSNLLEAIVHGLCEVIERDAEELWYRSAVADRVDLDSVDDRDCTTLLDKLAAAQVYCIAFDITSDLGIPCYTCRLFEAPDAGSWRNVGGYVGSACSLVPEQALGRAIMEAIQSRLTQIAGSRDDMLRDSYASVVDLDLLQAVWHEYQTLAPTVRTSARSRLATESLQGDVRLILEHLRARDIESAVVVDLSHPDIGIPVVKVVIPGLEAGTDVAEPGARARAFDGEQVYS
jgi:YcaO-like protein with predicted kinase domain